MKQKTLTRRKFIRDSSAAALAGSLYLSVPVPSFASDYSGKSRVVLIRNKNVLDSLLKPDKAVLSEMLDAAVCSLFDTTDALNAWKTILSPEDVVGIKTNHWNYLHTPAELEEIILERVLEAGVSRQNVSVKDRGILNDKVFMKATALINTRPMRTHYWAGVGSLIKNYIQFVNKPSEYHYDSCADLASIWKQPRVAGKTRLNILVMLTPLFHGVGPHHFSPEFIWPYFGLIAGTDPVAVDATGVRIIQAKRLQYFGEEMPLNPPPKHIFLAETKHKLGYADPEKIELIRLGENEDSLI